MRTQVQTWEEYKKWVASVIANKKDYYYRGQADAKWELQTTFHREAVVSVITLDTYLNDILPRVHYYICAWHNEIINLQDPNEFGSFLALLQHHGFPTPLLDWTLSPYIAAYFAFREVNDKLPQVDHVKIYIFDFQVWTTTFQQLLDLRETKIAYVSVLFPYARFNPRIIHQMGTYTVTNQPDMGAYILKRSQEVNKDFLRSFTFSVKERTKVMRELNLMGINEMALFPGLEGVCHTMREWFFSKDHVGLTKSEFNELLRKLLQSSTTKKTEAEKEP
ncbi:MAG: FRG domain-containing protein [Candidatus Omnitrophota bacterium]|nr:FRG domain-containing protein [Candidatus Omnitrophota bacterium]